MANNNRTRLRQARHVRLRKSLSGTSERPRLVVHRSLKHISAQLIDDTTGHTLAAASTVEKALSAKGTTDGAKLVGAKLAERAKEAGISAIVFDRGGFKYHGQVASLADGAREAGLEF